MVYFSSTDSRPRTVLLLSLTTSILLVIFFLSLSLLTNVSRGEISYTQVDMVAGSIFVFVISMIISLSLWPKIADWLESKKKNKIPE